MGDGATDDLDVLRARAELREPSTLDIHIRGYHFGHAFVGSRWRSEEYRCKVSGGSLLIVREYGMVTFQGKFVDDAESWGNRLYTKGRFKRPEHCALKIVDIFEAAKAAGELG